MYTFCMCTGVFEVKVGLYLPVCPPDGPEWGEWGWLAGLSNQSAHRGDGGARPQAAQGTQAAPTTAADSDCSLVYAETDPCRQEGGARCARVCRHSCPACTVCIPMTLCVCAGVCMHAQCVCARAFACVSMTLCVCAVSVCLQSLSVCACVSGVCVAMGMLVCVPHALCGAGGAMVLCAVEVCAAVVHSRSNV